MDPKLTLDEALGILQGKKDGYKMEVLRWFGNRDMDDIISHLLEIGLYSAEDLKTVTLRSFGERSRKVLFNYSQGLYESFNSVEELLAFKTPFARTNGEDFFQKLVYFHEHDPQMYLELLRKSNGIHRRGLSTELFKTENFTKHREIVITLAGLYSGLEDSIAYRKLSRADQEAFYKEVLTEVRKRQKQEGYKHLTNAELIMYRSTEENKWEILEYFAENNLQVFKRIVRQFTIKDQTRGRLGYLVNETLARYGDREPSSLPPALAEYVNSLKPQPEQEKKETPRKKFDNLAEGAKHIVKVGKSWVVEEEDKISLVEKFLVSDLSIGGFCRRYNISDENAFKGVLNYIGNQEAYYAKRITDVLRRHRDEHLNTIKEGLKGVARDTKEVNELINDANISLEQYHQFAIKYYNKFGVDIIFADRVSKYYKKRLNEFSGESVEGINNALTRQEIKFIVGSEDYDKMLKGKNGAVDAKFRTLLKGCAVSTKNAISECAEMLKPYNSKFVRKEYFSARTFLVDDVGEQVEVDENMVNQALSYARANGLYTSNRVVKSIINLVAKGELDYSAESAQRLYAKRQETLALIEEISNLDDYFSAIDSLYSE